MKISKPGILKQENKTVIGIRVESVENTKIL